MSEMRGIANISLRERLGALSHHMRHYYSRHGRFPNLVSPKSFTEKLTLRCLETSNIKTAKLLSRYVDKLIIRSYVKETIGESYLPKVYFTYSQAEDLRRSDLQRPLALKTNHGSGTIQFFDGKAIPTGESWFERAVSLATQDLSKDYSKYRREFQYRFVARQIFGEELLQHSEQYDRLYTAYVYCFDGKASLIQMYDLGKKTNSFFDLDWNQIQMTYRPQCDQPSFESPSELNELILAAERLSSPFDFVRVDFNLTANGLKFSELTFTPTAGGMVITPEYWDLRLGLLWNYRSIRNNKNFDE